MALDASQNNDATDGQGWSVADEKPVTAFKDSGEIEHVEKFGALEVRITKMRNRLITRTDKDTGDLLRENQIEIELLLHPESKASAFIRQGKEYVVDMKTYPCMESRNADKQTTRILHFPVITVLKKIEQVHKDSDKKSRVIITLARDNDTDFDPLWAYCSRKANYWEIVNQGAIDIAFSPSKLYVDLLFTVAQSTLPGIEINVSGKKKSRAKIAKIDGDTPLFDKGKFGGTEQP